MSTSETIQEIVDQETVDGWKDVGLDYLEKRLRTTVVMVRDYPHSRFYNVWLHSKELLTKEIERRKAVRGGRENVQV